MISTQALLAHLKRERAVVRPKRESNDKIYFIFYLYIKYICVTISTQALLAHLKRERAVVRMKN